MELVAIFAALATALASYGINKYNTDTALEKSEKQNKENMALIRETNAQNVQLSNTAHTREVADLRNSGLSAYASTTGASTPDLTPPQSDVDYGQFAQMRTQGYESAVKNGADILQATWNHDISQQNVNNQVEQTKIQKKFNDEKMRVENARVGIEKQYLAVDSEKAKIMNDVTLSQEERSKKMFEYDIESALLKNASQKIQNEETQWNFNIMRDNEEYYRALPKAQYNMQVAECSYVLSQKSNLLAEKVANEYKNVDLHNLNQAQVEKIMEDMKLDKKKFKWQVVKDVLSGVGDVLKFGGINQIKKTLSHK